jgi:membrane protease YdiL (CAAX protease family)
MVAVAYTTATMTLSSQPPSAHRPHTSRRRLAAALAVVLAVLAAVNIADKFGPAHTGLVAGPLVALGLVLLARRAGLTWHDLGLSRHTVGTGLKYASAAVLAVAVVYAIGAALPLTRQAFLDVRYQLHLSAALVAAFVVVPLGTVVLEEVAFRGVLLGLVHRHRGAVWASVSSSMLFGLWHILPSLHLSRANQAVGAMVGGHRSGQLLAVLAAVGFTALAGLLLCEVRRRSGSLLAAAGLHWATNGLGVLLTAALAAIRLV